MPMQGEQTGENVEQPDERRCPALAGDSQARCIREALHGGLHHWVAVVAPLRLGSDKPPPADWCGPDACPSSICNGPHVSHHCPNGDLVTQRFDDATPCPFCGHEAPANGRTVEVPHADAG